MLIILFILKNTFISVSLLITLRASYKFVWATIWEINLFKSMTFSKTSNCLGSVAKCSDMFAASSNCTFFTWRVGAFLPPDDLIFFRVGWTIKRRVSTWWTMNVGSRNQNIKWICDRAGILVYFIFPR